MSLTPIEDPDNSGATGPPGGESSGVRQRLHSFVSRVKERVVGTVAALVPGASNRGDEKANRRGADRSTSIAPGWSGKLEDSPTRQSPELPAGRRGAHTTGTDGDVTATVEEDRLTIEHSDRSEEYISSDVYTRIER